MFLVERERARTRDELRADLELSGLTEQMRASAATWFPLRAVSRP
jgi:hypothetical protein